MTKRMIITPVLLLCLACGSMEASKESGDNRWTDAASDPGPWANDQGAAADTAGETLPPPEDEIDADFRVPQASGRFIYVANAAEDYVVVIDSMSLNLEIVNVGRKPVEIATRGLSNSAMVLNAGSRDLSLIRTVPSEGSRVKSLPSIEGMSSIEISPAGVGAIVFHDFDAAAVREGGEDLASYQDVMVVRLGEGAETSLQRTCGYMPWEVEYDEGGTTAYVINKDGISQADLADASGSTAPLPIVRYPSGIPAAITKDVDVSPTGDFALVRANSAMNSIWVVGLKDGDSREIVLPGPPYDLDLSPAGDFAVAVLPTLAKIALVKLPPDEEEPFVLKDVEGIYAGQAHVSGDGKLIALFSNQADEELVGVYDVARRSMEVIPLHKTVKTVAFTPDGALLAVIHAREEGAPDPADYEDVADHSEGYSLVRLSDGFVKQQLTKAPPEPFLVHPAGGRIYLLQRDDALDVREVEIIDTASFVVTRLKLGSPPVSIGYLPESDKVYVSQDHASGRITFIDGAGHAQTVTGFELNDWIVE